MTCRACGHTYDSLFGGSEALKVVVEALLFWLFAFAVPIVVLYLSPQGVHLLSRFNDIAERGSPNHPTQSLDFLPRLPRRISQILNFCGERLCFDKLIS